MPRKIDNQWYIRFPTPEAKIDMQRTIGAYAKANGIDNAEALKRLVEIALAVAS